jgi:predicted RND superfamily exporter protein
MEAPESRFYQWLARTCLRHRYPVLAVYALITATLGYHAVTALVVDNSTEAFVVADSGPAQVLDELFRDFGSDKYLQVVVEGDVFSLDFLERLRRLHDALSSIDVELDRPLEAAPDNAPDNDFDDFEDAPDGAFDDFEDFGAVDPDAPGVRADAWGEEGGGSVIDETVSLLNARDVRAGPDGSIEVRDLLDPLPNAAALPALRQRVLSDPALLGRVVGREGHHAVVLLRLQPMSELDSRKVYDAAIAIAEQQGAPGFAIHVGGVPAMNTVLNRTMSDDMVLLSGLSLLVAGLVLLYIFRHLLAALGPALVIGQAFCWVLGLMALADVPLTMVTSALPAFLTAVGLGDAIHIQSTYRDARMRGMDNDAAIERALGHTGTPIAYTSLTTAIGLLSFQFASLPAIRDLGLYGALGVGFAYLLSTTFLPIVLHYNRTSLMGARPAEQGRDRIDAFLARCSALSAPRRHSRRRLWVTLAVGAVLLAGMLASLTRLQVYHNIMTWLPADLPMRVATQTLDEHVGGTASVVLLVEPKPGGSLTDPALLHGLEAFEREMQTYDDPRFGLDAVSNVTSLLDILRETNRTLHGGDQAHYRIPDDARAVRDILTLLESSGESELRQLVTVDLARTMVVLRVRWMDASGYEPLVAHVERGIEAHLADHARVRITGSVHNLFWVVVRLLDDLLRSFSLAFVVITVVMLLLLRDVKLGLLAMVPNLMPVAAILSFMVAADIPIDINNLMVASVAIGIAVDDTIHFLHQFQRHYREHGDTESAIAHAFSTTGRAMISTTMIMAGGFSVFLGATLINMQRFGMLMMLTVISALLIDLIFTPALLRLLYGSGSRVVSDETGPRGSAQPKQVAPQGAG